MGDLEQAKRHYQAELQINPGDDETLLDLGELLIGLLQVHVANSSL